MKIETIAVHAGLEVDPATGAVVPPIHLSTTFERGPAGEYPHGFVYSRRSNPTRNALEQALAAIEGGETAIAFSSGSAATAAMLQALAPGDHVIAPHDSYYGTAELLRDIFGRWGLETSFVDFTNVAAVENAVRPETKMIWIETPSNPLLKVVDLARTVVIARAAGAVTVCDNTFAPTLQRPLALGVDFVMHSTTKYIGGHSDVLGGAIVAKSANDFAARVRQVQSEVGAVPSPFECWLLLRSIRSLPWRVRAHSENAMAVATFLEAHPRVQAVHYPGLRSHQGHALAKQQMSGFGGMLSFQVAGDAETAMQVAAKTRVFTRATSLGGVESLIEHRASIEGPESRTPQNLLRVSVGLEHPEDLIADLAQALR
jgi:cystathionine gamma-synthase